MAHDHHHHEHLPKSRRVLWLAVGLTLLFSLIEAISGLISGSLALLGDAGHMLTDSMSLGLAAAAAWLAMRRPSLRHSYGLGRAELLAALFNGLLMIGVVVAISVAAVNRLLLPREVTGETVTLVAVIGLLINLLVAWLLSHSSGNINVRSALLHVMGDLLGSIAALISGVVITYTGWTPIDPILSLVIALLILFSSIHLLREGLHLLLDGVPPATDLQQVGESLAQLEGVLEVHDLHIWSLSAERTALSAHLVIDTLEHWPGINFMANKLLRKQFQIDHLTLQPELFSEAEVTIHLDPERVTIRQ